MLLKIKCEIIFLIKNINMHILIFYIVIHIFIQYIYILFFYKNSSIPHKILQLIMELNHC